MSIVRLFTMAALLFAALLLSCSGSSTGNDDDDVQDVDLVPPATVADLRVHQVFTDGVTLRWTAPGDDDTQGVAAEYDLRGTLDSITEATFSSVYRITDIYSPAPAGVEQWYTVDSLEAGEHYYFALKTCDEAGNWSELSNCVGATCPTNQVVVFVDTALERVIRAAISKPTGDIHVSDLEPLQNLIADEQNISDLSGIEHCSSLFALHLRGNHVTSLDPVSTLSELRILSVAANQVTDVSPLTPLTGLTQLLLGENTISDLGPLTGMTELEVLRINNTGATEYTPLYGMSGLDWFDGSWNPVSNISFIAHFPDITQLWLSGCGISDLIPLTGRTSIRNLYLGYNQIATVSPLSGLTNLEVLNLDNNQITDLQPLVDNSGFAAGDELFVRNNPLTTTALTVQIPALQARGVTVVY